MGEFGFRDQSLLDTTSEEIEGLLDLGETLFCEHKASEEDLGQYQLSKAIASFGNTLGGWVLLGVRDGKPVDSPAEWITQGALVDGVRDRIRGQLDPLPPFEARTITLDDHEIGVVRVYESADAPIIHVQSGAIYVREPAGDRDTQAPTKPGRTAAEQRRWRVGQIRSQHDLVELQSRGETARKRVALLFKPLSGHEITEKDLGLTFNRVAGPVEPGLQAATTDAAPSVIVRAAPLTRTARFEGWARSELAADAASKALTDLAGEKSTQERTPRAQGLRTLARLEIEKRLTAYAGSTTVTGTAIITVDAAGLLGARIALNRPVEIDIGEMSVEVVRDKIFGPPLRALAQMLEEGGFLGRVAVHYWVFALTEVAKLEVGSEYASTTPGPLPIEGEITLPLAPGEQDDVMVLADEAARTYARACGFETWGRTP